MQVFGLPGHVTRSSGKAWRNLAWALPSPVRGWRRLPSTHQSARHGDRHPPRAARNVRLQNPASVTETKGRAPFGAKLYVSVVIRPRPVAPPEMRTPTA